MGLRSERIKIILMKLNEFHDIRISDDYEQSMYIISSKLYRRRGWTTSSNNVNPSYGPPPILYIKSTRCCILDTFIQYIMMTIQDIVSTSDHG